MKKEDINLGFPLGKVKRAKTIETFNGNWFVISSLIIPSQLQITTFKSYPEDVWLHGECSLISNNSFNNDKKLFVLSEKVWVWIIHCAPEKYRSEKCLLIVGKVISNNRKKWRISQTGNAQGYLTKRNLKQFPKSTSANWSKWTTVSLKIYLCDDECDEKMRTLLAKQVPWNSCEKSFHRNPSIYQVSSFIWFAFLDWIEHLGVMINLRYFDFFPLPTEQATTNRLSITHGTKLFNWTASSWFSLHFMSKIILFSKCCLLYKQKVYRYGFKIQSMLRQHQK